MGRIADGVVDDLVADAVEANRRLVGALALRVLRARIGTKARRDPWSAPQCSAVQGTSVVLVVPAKSIKQYANPS